MSIILEVNIQEKYERMDRASYGYEQWQEGEKKGREEGREEGEAAGTFNTLSSLVEDGLLPLPEAARRAGLSEEAFRKKMTEKKEAALAATSEQAMPSS